MTEPTDAEIRGLAATGNGVYQDDETAIWEITDPSLMKLARAALTKWGQPAQAGEPVAYLTRNAEGDPEMLFFDKDEASTYCEDGVDPAPLFTAPKPVALEPLTSEQIGQDPIFRAGVRFAEQYHGIKGGQHGTE